MLKIKEFAVLCGCSIHTLRYYDQIDLLKPIIVDRDSGYRFYKKEQILDYKRIKEFQDIGFSIDDIKKFNNSDSVKKIELILDKIEEIIKMLDKALIIKEQYK